MCKCFFPLSLSLGFSQNRNHHIRKTTCKSGFSFSYQPELNQVAAMRLVPNAWIFKYRKIGRLWLALQIQNTTLICVSTTWRCNTFDHPCVIFASDSLGYGFVTTTKKRGNAAPCPMAAAARWAGTAQRKFNKNVRSHTCSFVLQTSNLRCFLVEIFYTACCWRWSRIGKRCGRNLFSS